uniref:Helitron helicase-like domain-containing protein n=1 Tax=Strigamia maritima TaxID=126957 RepID=T1IKV2_STRMM
MRKRKNKKEDENPDLKKQNDDLKKQRNAKRKKDSREKKTDSQKEEARVKDRDRKRLKRAADKEQHSESAKIKEQTERKRMQFEAEQARIKPTKEEVRCLLFENENNQQTADLEELRRLVIDVDQKQQDQNKNAERQKAHHLQSEEPEKERVRIVDAHQHKVQCSNMDKNQRKQQKAANLVDQRQSRTRKVMESSTYKATLNPNVSEVKEFYLGKMDIECSHCGALHFKGEILSSRCCHKGKVKLPLLKKYPEPLKDLLLGSDKRIRDFRTHIRQYNSLLSFASMIATMPVLPPSSSEFTERFITKRRRCVMKQIKIHLLHNCTYEQLMTELHKLIVSINNPYVTAYHTMREVEERERELAKKEGNRSMRRVHMVIEVNKSGNDKRRYNDATETDIAAVFVGDDGNYYSYCFSVKGGTEDLNPILLEGRLFQQFVVDSYITVQSERLQYIRQHQTQLPTDQYRGLLDYVRSKAEDSNLKAGKLMILPATFTGGPRDMQENYQINERNRNLSCYDPTSDKCMKRFLTKSWQSSRD